MAHTKIFKLSRFSSLVKNIPKYCSTSSTVSTVNTAEVEHFSNLKNDWWNEEGAMKPLHMMNRLRVPFLRDGLIHTGVMKKEVLHTATPLANVSILDVGCGGGILSEALARVGGRVTGLDPSHELIEQAKQHAQLDRSLEHLTYISGTVEEHATTCAEHYDAVIASEVVEHIERKEAFLEACVACLKPGGSIFITTLNKTIASWLNVVVLAEMCNFVPRGTHDWELLVAPQSLQRTLEDYNCRTVVVHGMCYNAITNRWSWISDVSISYALQAIKVAK